MKARVISACILIGASVSFAVEEEVDKQIYALDASTSSGLDLTTMEGYYADRIYGPTSADITFSGPLTVDPAVSAENPFQVLGRGKKITVNVAGSGFQYLPLKLRNAEGVTKTSTFTFSAGNPIRIPLLDIGKYNKFTKAYYGDGNQRFQTSKLLIHDGGEASGYGYMMGEDQANFEMSVTDGGSFSGSYLYVGYQKTDSGQGHQTASLYVSNAAVKVTSVGASSDGKSLSFMFGCTAASDTTENCKVTIAKDGVINAPVTRHNGAGRSTVIFDGGRYKSEENTTTALFYSYGLNYKGGYSSPRIHLQGANGNPIDIEISANRNLASGRSGGSGRINVSGSGGFTKRGTGTLSFTRLNSSTCDYTGPTTILGGGIVVKNANFKPGRGALSVSEGCFLDLNGFDCSFATAEGSGVVTNGADGASTLTLGYGDASGAFSLATSGSDVNVNKTGAGTLTVSGAALANTGDLTISSGTVVFAGNSASYGVVTVEAGTTLDIRGISFACASLDNRGTLLTDSATVLSLGSDGDLSFNNGLVGLSGGLVKTGTGVLSVYGAETIGGVVEVKAGTLRVLPGKWAGNYFKLNLQWAESSDNNQWHKRLGTFALYDAAGNDVARSITVQNPTAGATGVGLAEGEVRFGDTGFYSVPEGKGVLNLFDGKDSTQFDLQSGWGSEFIVLRLPDSTGDIVGYNFNNGIHGQRLVTWNLYGSVDGKVWTLLGNHLCANWNDMEERQKVTDETPNTDGAWYNDGVPYCFSAYSNATGRVFGENAVVSVAPDATLDLGGIGMELGHLAIDCAGGAGTILRFSPAENGMLELTNADVDQLKAGYVLPLAFGEIANAGRFKTWTVKVNGVVDNTLRIRREPDGCVKVMPKGGLILVVR